MSSASLTEVDSDITSQTAALEDSSTRDKFCLSKDQYNAIIALLQQTKDSSTSVNHIQHFVVNQSVVVANIWFLQQLDVDNAFLYEDLHEEVYMKPPLKKYYLEILSEFGLTGCKLANSPANASIRLNSDEGDLLEDVTSFRRLIGRLLYLTNIRPDIVFVVQQVSQFVSKPRTPYLQLALRILRYLKGALGLGLFYPVDNDLKIQAFFDSDWATCPVSRKSVTGYCVFLGNSLIMYLCGDLHLYSCFFLYFF
ncbi:uncharacterized mitochondrial protein AtMg00810-like [Glycine max]|uniref:uncharacterized mitochondrial protein AtMg00810-like n=1 Tax=Glycine max TaxID=3847 RepID=UPI0003DE7554|nr:uncharacterized mitochondrial protein AtMg00810-like [Glycine max]|eukprot:XP_006582764.1 uncharacterized protein LOC102665133 [Glycine max]